MLGKDQTAAASRSYERGRPLAANGSYLCPKMALPTRTWVAPNMIAVA